MKSKHYLFSFLGLATLLFSCSKNQEQPLETTGQSELSFEERIMAIPNNEFEDTQLITAYSAVMKEVLKMSKDGEFRNLVFENVQEANEFDQDYVFEIENMTKTLKSFTKFDKSSAKLESMVSKIQSLSPEDAPMIFYPKAETIEDNLKANKNYDVAKNLNEPIAVLKGAFNNDYSAPGYKLDTSGKLVFDRMVTEDYAWNNDVYVIGAAENVDMNGSANITPIDDEWGGGGGGSGGGSSSNTRVDGRAEGGGLIQVLALNEIEHWTAGKLEFRLIVSGLRNSGGTITNDLKFPKIARKHFKDKKWYDYGVFLSNWNLTNLADYSIEKWMERDNGLYESSIEISIPGTSFKPATSTTPAQPALPGTKISLKYRKGDEDLGTSLIQFSDNISQVYNLGQANIKRK